MCRVEGRDRVETLQPTLVFGKKYKILIRNIRKTTPSLCLSGTIYCEVHEKEFLGTLCRDGKLSLCLQHVNQRKMFIKAKNEVRVRIYKKGRLDFYGGLPGPLFFHMQSEKSIEFYIFTYSIVTSTQNC